MTDFERVIYCLTFHPQGILYDKNDADILYKYNQFFACLQKTKRRPDAYAVKNNELLLLEHFQFDNTRSTKKGSEQHKVKAKSNQIFNKKQLSNGNFAVLTESVKKSGALYIDNFMAQFNSHYAKIDQYIQEMKFELSYNFQTIHIGFVIEDSSPLGSIYLNNYEPHCLDLLQTTEFLNVFENSSKLDFVIFVMTGNADNLVESFISRKTIEQHKEVAIQAQDIQSFLFEQSFVASSLIELNK